MSLLDFLGKSPPPYDPRYDRATRPDFGREKTLKAHVEECGKRYIELRAAIQDGAIEQFNTRRLLWAVIGLLVVNKVLDIGQLVAFLGH